MKARLGRRTALPFAAGLLAAAVGCSGGGVKVEVTEKDRFDTAGNMFAYAEFELSGEPLAESLGLDLDLLDPNKPDQPGKFDYAAGIESYEYSEEGMYEVVEKSGLGLHLVSGPEVKAIAKQRGVAENEALVSRLRELADSVGYPFDEVHQGMYPTLIEYAQGDPHYAQKVDTGKFADGENGAYVPKFQVDFSSLRWDRAKMDKTLVPSAYGATLLKQALWAGDFLGNVHAKDSDEELDAASAIPAKDDNVALGVSSVDGMQGMILTEEMWNKLSFIRQGLFLDAATGQLTSGQGAAYDPAQGLVYLPHAISVSEDGNQAFPGAGSLQVTDARSLLRDQWLVLWPAAEYYGMVDQRTANLNRNPAFGYAFDGSPFPSAPNANVDADPANDTPSGDPYTVGRDVLIQVFRNLAVMHWNASGGWLAAEHDGKQQGAHGSTFDAGYAMEALRMFERAVDGLPVGYANGEGAVGLHTEEGKQALDMIKRQADFLLSHVIREDGLAANGWNSDGKADDSSPTLLSQAGAIRGLTSAYLATQDEKYRLAARKVFDAADRLLWNGKWNAYRTDLDGSGKYDAFTAGGVSAMLRLGLSNLRNDNNDAETYSSLERDALKARYVSFYRTIVNGPDLDGGMQASEFWDTGDAYKEGDDSGNTDGDTVPQIQKAGGSYGVAPILRAVEVSGG
ncbi:hypothetical protein GE107_14435 [Cohnella sp. CFH 77786]|uniref:hypothetical protein n=1 Tax=Cohnella sp. CFH 77786 TaxID=2662265 RepID=UPI001C609FFD|nr:hypothetical protein [Cohnella sp. CFH 77786]MBW5447250.1 hypothetical protein [Cohnella sp. CFH 77786]